MTEGPLSCSFVQNMHPQLKRLMLWRNPTESGIFLVVVLTILFSLACLSFISVVAYLCLTLLCCTAGFKIYQEAHRTISKSDSPASANPISDWMNLDLSLPEEKVHNMVKTLLDQSSCRINYLRRMLVLENYIESAKFAFGMYLLTWLGHCFNLLTLITLAFTVLMTWPKIYELYQPQIDKAYNDVHAKVMEFWKPISEKLENLPIIGKKKPE